MEQETRESASPTTREAGNEMTDIVVVDLESYVNVELDMENNNGISEVEHNVSGITQGMCRVFFILKLLWR